MKPITSHALPALLLVAAAATTATAQSLVEVARQERMRREALARHAGPDAAPPKVYTDANLVHSGGLTVRVGDGARVGDAAPAGDATPAAAGAAAARSESPALPPSDAGAAGDEQRWRDRMTAARQALEEAELRAAALQTRVNGLWADFTNRDDPAQRAALEQERQAALAELDETRAAIDELARAVVALRDEARQAGVPPGWLRQELAP